MAKLTLQFKGKPIDVFLLEGDRVSIGREPDNNIVIDSLAIAPYHLAFSQTDDQYKVSVETEQFPVFINDKKADNETLRHGDLIRLGKHTLLYSDEVTSSLNLLAEEFDLPDSEPEQTVQVVQKEDVPFPASVPKASLQIMSGPEIGRLIPLSRRVTELHLHDLVPAIIARRAEGYIVSRLLDEVTITINGSEIEQDGLIQDGDMLVLGDKKHQFFLDPI